MTTLKEKSIPALRPMTFGIAVQLHGLLYAVKEDITPQVVLDLRGFGVPLLYTSDEHFLSHQGFGVRNEQCKT